MKLIIYFLSTCIITSNLYADALNYLKQMNKKEINRIEKEQKEWNNPNNKYLRELTKKHYGKALHGDKEQEKLQKNIVNSIKENK